MKTKLAVVLALSSTAVFAQDLQLGDLNFFQKKGSVQWNTEVSAAKFEEKIINQDTEEYEIKTNVWSNEVTYGISDKFRVGLAVDYAFKNETEDKSSGSDIKNVNNDGLSDFSVVSAYRLMSGNLFVDVLGKFTAAIGDKKVGTADATESKDGNYKQGHHSLDLGVAAGQKMGQFEWRASAGVVYRFEGETKGLNIGAASATLDTDARLDISLNGQLQYRPTSKLAINAGIDWINPGDQKGLYSAPDGTKLEFTVKSPSPLTSNVVVKYNLSDSILLNAGYRFTNSYDFDTKYKSDSTSGKSKNQDNKLSTLFLGASFLF
jgi:opacity protein-like surface antigen